MILADCDTYIPKNKVKLVTVVEGDQKAPFSIATTPRCRRGRYAFPRIAPLYPWRVPYIAEFEARRYQVPFFFVFGMTWTGIKPRPPGPLANTLPTNVVEKVPKWVEETRQFSTIFNTVPYEISALAPKMLNYCSPITEEGSILILQKLLHNIYDLIIVSRMFITLAEFEFKNQKDVRLR